MEWLVFYFLGVIAAMCCLKIVHFATGVKPGTEWTYYVLYLWSWITVFIFLVTLVVGMIAALYDDYKFRKEHGRINK